MKLKYIIPIILIIALFTSCTSDDNDNEIAELEGLTKVQDIVNEDHTVEIYTKSGNFYTGYNDVSIRIKDNTNHTYFENFTITWMPMMAMASMNHSCPKSIIVKTENKETLYNGFVIYQMTGLDGNGWSMKFMYTIDGTDYMAEDTIIVMQSDRQNVTTFMGSDAVKYIAAIVEPTSPEIAINDLTVALFKMESMMMFPVVPNYSFTLDPRMPSMGNHSSPNNTDLTYDTTEKMYHGDLSLTMSGYWVLNLKLLNTNNEVLKGEEVTSTNTQSSLYLELEF